MTQTKFNQERFERQLATKSIEDNRDLLSFSDFQNLCQFYKHYFKGYHGLAVSFANMACDPFVRSIIPATIWNSAGGEMSFIAKEQMRVEAELKTNLDFMRTEEFTL